MLKFNEMGKHSYLDFFVHCNVSQFKKKPGDWKNIVHISECRKQTDKRSLNIVRKSVINYI